MEQFRGDHASGAGHRPCRRIAKRPPSAAGGSLLWRIAAASLPLTRIRWRASAISMRRRVDASSAWETGERVAGTGSTTSGTTLVNPDHKAGEMSGGAVGRGASEEKLPREPWPVHRAAARMARRGDRGGVDGSEPSGSCPLR